MFRPSILSLFFLSPSEEIFHLPLLYGEGVLLSLFSSFYFVLKDEGEESEAFPSESYLETEKR